MKFTPEGGEVSIEIADFHDKAVLCIKDTGIGIDPAFLPHVFDRFRQADGSTTRRQGGLGLGLSIVRQLVELHGGTIVAGSDGLGRGASFMMTLPLSPSHAQQSGTAVPQQPEPNDMTLADLSGCEILVVDDERDARALAEEMLCECGAKVRVAANAEDALAALDERPSDVLVCDIGMPVVDGFELMRRIRSGQGSSTCVPAIALTAFTRAEDRERALRAGFDGFLQKPVNAQQLVSNVASLWRTGRGHSKTGIADVADGVVELALQGRANA